MRKLADRIRRNRADLLVASLRLFTYAGLFFILFGLLSIHNWQLRNISRTLATTILTWAAMTVTMTHIYGGYDVGRKKSNPIISSMALANLCTDAVTFLQLQIMNVNPNNNAHLVLWGPDFWLLLAAFIAQTFYLAFMVRLGNRLYFRYHQPRACLLIMGQDSSPDEITEKIGHYRLQWHVHEIASWDDPALPEKIKAADVVFFADVPPEGRMQLLQMCYDLHHDVLCKAQLQEIMLSAADPLVVDDALFMEMDYHKMSPGQRIIKRLADFVLSGIALLLFSPLMLLIALAIRLDDGGPAFFLQDRMTAGGQCFRICKFRTMSVGAPEQSETENDQRVTRVGRLLRASRLDELPQLWNILKGDMSLVGPRPEMLSNVEFYKSSLPTFIYREKVKAGLTGYAQIEGRYNTSPEDKLMLDLMYIENFSIWNDVRLLFRTLTVFFKRDSTAPFSSGSAPGGDPASH